MSEPKSFCFPAARSLYKHLGEADALIEVTELACRFYAHAAHESGDVVGFVASTSAEFGVCVNMAELKTLKAHLAQSYIVAVYESAERFLREFRREHILLYGKDWTGDSESKDRLTLCLENIGMTLDQAEKAVGLDLVSRFQYYRLVRNWIIHEKHVGPTKLAELHGSLLTYSEATAKALSSLNAPNLPKSLTFDDFVLFSRLTKLVADRLCRLVAPTEDHWLTSFDLKPFKSLSKKPDRMRNAVAGRLQTQYGLQKQDAQWISQNLCDSLA